MFRVYWVFLRKLPNVLYLTIRGVLWYTFHNLRWKTIFSKNYTMQCHINMIYLWGRVYLSLLIIISYDFWSHKKLVHVAMHICRTSNCCNIFRKITSWSALLQMKQIFNKEKNSSLNTDVTSINLQQSLKWLLSTRIEPYILFVDFKLFQKHHNWFLLIITQKLSDLSNLQWT